MDNIIFKYKHSDGNYSASRRQERDSYRAQVEHFQKVVGDNAYGRWFALTFRVDSVVLNGSNLKQSVWSTDPTYAIQKVIRSVDWTVTELRRYHKELPFISWIGGDESIGVKTHIHAAIKIPDLTSLEQFSVRVNKLFNRNLGKTLKTQVKSSVIFVGKITDATAYSLYAGRSEGKALIRGTDKVLTGRSFKLD